MTDHHAPPIPSREPFRLGDRTAFPQRNRILGPAGEVHVEPRVMDVLCVLAAHAGEVMSREALINGVWAVKYGGDESLTRAISILRKALGPGCIETIAKRGYRLASPVEQPDPRADSSATAEPAEPVESPRPNWGYELRQQGRGPNRVYPVASLDFWRLPPAAFAVVLTLAIGIAAADAGLFWPGR